jgi:hypothetical protein
MALPWLDAARYADSNGFQQDGDHWQWIWRDHLVQALNENQPFDEFTIWQLAGDLLPEPTQEQQIASAFNRNHMLNGEGGAIAEEQRWVNLFDRVDTTATTWLGLTLACAQCHDHKYDPLTQTEYYQFLDAFNRVPEKGMPRQFSTRIRIDEPYLELPTAANQQRIAELQQQERTEELDRYRADQIPRVMIMSDAQPRETHRLDRGEYLSPLENVTFDTPAILPPLHEQWPKNRLGLARWLVSDEHPLTARVQVNRMWQHFFGQGLVKTSEDFGVQSEYPLHLDLLDWLAVEFRDSGWDVKHLHRLMLLSAVYRQDSRISSDALQWDPENRYLARAPRFRMPSMLLRDWALATSETLNPAIGGAPVYPYQPPNVWESLAITKERDFTYPEATGTDLYRRSLYTFWRRTVGPANMFDSSNRQICRVRRPATSTPLHALVTLNDRTWAEAARQLAAAAMRRAAMDSQAAEPTSQKIDQGTAQGPDQRAVQALSDAFWRVLCRPADDSELERLVASYHRWHARYAAEPELAHRLLAVGASPADQRLDPAQHAAMTVACLTILNLDEALTRE